MKSKIDIDNKIDAYIKENENGDITATQLNEILKEINAALFGFMDTYLSTPFSSLGGETVITKFSKLTEQLTGIADRVTALENGGGGSTDNYALSGSFSYSGNIAASGGTKTPINTLGITKNGVAVSGVTITYSSNQSYAIVSSNGTVTFSSHTNTSVRTATITATVTDGTHTFTKTANVTQSAYVSPTETIELTGTFGYSKTASAEGEVLYINSASNTLKLTKNGVELSGVTFTYSLSGSSSYATVDPSSGAVAFQSNSGAARSVSVVAKCIYNGTTYTSSAVTVSQAAYVAPVETNYFYAGGQATWDDTMVISNFNETKSQASTNKTFTFTIDGYNIVGVVYPSNMSIASAKTGDLDEDITSTLKDNTTTVTYKGKSMKLSQIKFYAGTLTNQDFTIIFN